MKKPNVEPKSVTAANTREGKKAIAGYYPENVWLQFKTIGLEAGGKSMQDLLAEALNLLFSKYKKPPIA